MVEFYQLVVMSPMARRCVRKRCPNQLAQSPALSSAKAGDFHCAEPCKNHGSLWPPCQLTKAAPARGFSGGLTVRQK